MTKRMLIDSTHAEETRVVVLDGNRLEDFDVETSTKQQLKGNIYLAKIVRVEPSLQAAFVEYGGNRHGFLAFGEIHPDYYQIPVADRKRLLEAQEAEAREDEEAEEREAARASRREPAPAAEPAVPELIAFQPATEAAPADPAAFDEPMPRAHQVAQPAAIALDILVAPAEAEALFPVSDPAAPLGDGVDMVPEMAGAEAAADEAELSPFEAPGFEAAPVPFEAAPASADEDAAPQYPALEGPGPEEIGGEPEGEDHPDRRATPRFLRNYKIQEVIRRRQILLIQVVKEERGTKGAALTTYISLAGRFSVLMPNSPRGGGISRKITSAADRRRLKEVTSELDLPRGMGLIIRTAGANRPKPEILRDCEYLLGQWDQIRELTMKSMAPALIYEEASLIKRAIRDVYSRDVDDILVDGEQGWRAARDFMRMLMPTHARKVQLWKDPQPLFAKAQVEAQLDAMLLPTVQLKSGGYLVINQTEALVAIDVNSGRSTRERGIEETALRTNLEAADEAARQLRLRDLAGLIVIDFIDMESRRNNASVERRLKDALKIDRARIQVGSISHFGLLEMSRQRLRPSLAETSFVTCPHCNGTGHVRSTESAALHVLRAIEEEGSKRRAAEIVVNAAGGIALYILNHKRLRLSEIEQRYGMQVVFAADDSLLPPAIRIDKVRAQVASELPAPISQLAPPEPFEDPDELEAEAVSVGDDMEDDDAADAPRPGETAEEGEQRQKRRRRRRRGGRRDDAVAGAVGEISPPAGDVTAAPDTGDVTAAPEEAGDPAAAESTATDAQADAPPGPADGEEGERRRRGRRGGRRRRRDQPDGEGEAVNAEAETGSDEAAAPQAEAGPRMPAYSGPTPADPFGGASTFDIFDAMEQAEQERAAAVAAPMAVPAAPLHAPAAEAEPAYAAPEPVAEAPAAAIPEPAPEPAMEPALSPAAAPVLVGEQDAPAEKKRGWWRR